MRNRFFHCIILSIAIHTAIFCSFFRFVTLNRNLNTSEIAADTLSWEEYLKAISPKEFAAMALSSFTDSRAFDSLWEADSVSLLDFLEQMTLSDNSWITSMADGWYGGYADRTNYLRDILERYRQSKENDTLFALSEMMRRKVLERIIDIVKRSPNALPDSLSKWKRLIDLLAHEFQHSVGRTPNTATAATRRDMLDFLAEHPELVKIWKESMLFSLRKVALDSLLSASRDAARCALLKCGSGLIQNHDKTEGTGSGIVPLSYYSGNALFAGIDTVPPERFEAKYTAILNAIMKSKGFGSMISLFPFDMLVKSLAQEAENTLYSAMRSNRAGLEWMHTIDFEKAVSYALAKGMQCNTRTLKEFNEFLTTINQGLGKDLTDWIQWGPSPAQLHNNPHYFDEWAHSYLELLSSMASTPNVIMPNLEKIAQAARKMRNRYLPESEKIIMGNNMVLVTVDSIDSIDYFIPKWIYLPHQPQQHDSSSNEQRTLKKPDAPFHAFGGAVRKSLPITIDGNLTEWKTCRSFALCGSVAGFSAVPPSLKGSCLMVQWDNYGFYFAYKIFDKKDNSRYVATFWDTDALEIFLDPHNVKDSYRVAGRSYQFWIWPRASGTHGSIGISVFSDPHHFIPRPLKKGSIRFASRRDGDHYTCEAFLPAHLIRQWLPLPGKIIGFNFSINNGENRYLRWVTNIGANISLHPNLWGDLLLMGSDATVRINSGDFILPGASLDISVSDHDMNLVGNAPDKVWIRVRSILTGDAFPVCLVETGNNTGAFTGKINTQFAFNPRVKDRLSTRPGDLIEVFYLDQQRLGGGKNVPIIETVRVVRGVMTLR